MTIILIQAYAEQHHRAECVALCDDLPRVVLPAGIWALMRPVILRATCMYSCGVLLLYKRHYCTKHGYHAEINDQEQLHVIKSSSSGSRPNNASSGSRSHRLRSCISRREIVV